MTFIRLTSYHNNATLLINPDKIIALCPEVNSTRIYTEGEDGEYVVNESLEQITNKIP